MAAANESQGLKIAVAAFVTLSVVLAVTTYLGYSSFSETKVKLEEEQSKTRNALNEIKQFEDDIARLKARTGYARVDTVESTMNAITSDHEKMRAELANISQRVKQAVDQYRQAGGDQQRLSELQQAADRIIYDVTNMPEPNLTFADVQNRLVTLLDDLSEMNVELELDNQRLRARLNELDKANENAMQVEIGKASTAMQEVQTEHDRHEQERQDLVRRNDELQTLTARQATELAGLKQQLGQLTDKTDRQREQLLAQLRQWREQVEMREDIMDVPDGKIQFVDHSRSEVRTNLSRSDGVRERMTFSVFDSSSPGLTSDKPKGVVELIQVTDSGSVGRIISTSQGTKPIMAEDFLYSAAWSPDRPERFALVGKIDVDRDGRDDRADLKRLIERAGGLVDYDLPPPGVGLEKGELTSMTSWYVIDDLEPIRPQGRAATAQLVDEDFLKQKSEILSEARLNGVRPIALDRLLDRLGYQFHAKVPGQVEAIDSDAVRDLLNPGSRAAEVPVPATAPATTPAPTSGF